MATKEHKEIGSFRKVFGRNRSAICALAVILLLVAGAAAASYIAPFDPYKIDLDAAKEMPSLAHPFGTDVLGRDIMSRVMLGGRVSLVVGFVSTLSAFLIGLLFGILAGYCGGKVDRLVLGFIDMTLAFPSLLLAIGITAVSRGGIVTVLIALSAVGWAAFARIIRSAVLSLKSKEFVEAAHGAGAAPWSIVRRHIMPNLLPVSVVVMTMKIGGFIMSEASLSFLGLGIEPPFPSWGSMISDGVAYIRACPWITFFPGLALCLTVLSFNTLGDALRDVYDPKAD